MLEEIRHIRQIEGEPRRRWFKGRELELIVWQDNDNSIVAFELCYQRIHEQFALRWEYPAKYRHYRVDEGDDWSDRHKSTPVLLAGDGFDATRVAMLFDRESGKLDESLVECVHEKMLWYDHKKSELRQTGGDHWQ